MQVLTGYISVTILAYFYYIDIIIVKIKRGVP